MEFSLLHIISFLSLVLVATHAALEPEAYWNSVLPKTAMPTIVKELLHSEYMEEKGTSVSVGKSGVGVNTGKPGRKGTSVSVGKGGVGVSTGKPGGKGTNVGVRKGGVSVGTGGKGHPVYVHVKPYGPFSYNYAATDDQLHDNPNVALFFKQEDLHQGNQMNLHFTTSDDASATFLPRKDAESIPFSSKQFPEILSRFSMKPDSIEAKVMKQTIKECEERSIAGEDKYCATSLESMVDFTTSKLGKSVQAVSTDVDKKESPAQKFTFTDVKKMGDGDDNAVVCHKQEYAYAVFYCHKTSTTSAYLISMVGSDGTKAKAVAVCHKDTSAWNPKHLAFQVLKVRPGSVPVCHFLPEDHIVWVQK